MLIMSVDASNAGFTARNAPWWWTGLQCVLCLMGMKNSMVRCRDLVHENNDVWKRKFVMRYH